MFPVQKNNWQATASQRVLEQRAEYMSRIRDFFKNRGVLEVETPLLLESTVTDPHIESISAEYQTLGSKNSNHYYLQTSPEYAMKRLLASGCGPIYQITKAFRQGEVGRLHNPEFTMLEWYRPGFDHHQLMDELNDLLVTVFQFPKVVRKTYGEVFATYFNINPHNITMDELQQCANKHKINVSDAAPLEINFWLNVLFTQGIEPVIANVEPVFIYDFPVSQAALAKIRHENPPVASRFELYFKGVELANGFHELQNVIEQRQRFENDLAYRKHHALPLVTMDEKLLAALEHGLPDCSGVAVGIDRLMMLALQKNTISDVISFSFSHHHLINPCA